MLERDVIGRLRAHTRTVSQLRGYSNGPQSSPASPEPLLRSVVARLTIGQFRAGEDVML